ncbi:family 78 glycoside hydrolase catalytic domain [Microbacterium sp. KR10-403]|uniref:family 78 glycoside hydrolase catalytic domain n=1 Tax=Microbacterium sp. KR10-403 TaxID=3158581 RepID=UPI0032E446E6
MPDLSSDLGAPTGLRVDAQRGRHGTRLVPTASRRPRLSWVVPAGCAQTAARLEIVAGDGSTVFAETIETAAPAATLPVTLPPHAVLTCRVRLRDAAGRWTAWSQVSAIETGPLAFEDWTAQWVSHRANSVLRARLALPAAARRARLHLTAQGLVRAEVNGVPVNPGSTDATRTDIARALYRTYDVTDLVTAGANVLDLLPAAGAWAHTGNDPRVLAELVVECTDGTVHRIGTGPGLQTAPGEVTVHEPFYLERHEPAAATGTFATAHDLTVHEASCAPVSPADPPRDIAPDQTPPTHDVSTIAAVEIGRPGGTRVYDVGVNIAGRTRLVLSDGVASGLTVRIVHGEHLDADGRLDTTNLTMPYDHGRVRQALEFVTTGEAGQVCEPWFAYHGFRYVEVQGLPEGTPVTLTAHAHHTDLVQTGQLTTDDERLNRLLTQTPRTFLNNVHGIPEDCPTREQAGWTGDAASVAEFAFATFDLETFYRKWLGDLCTSQQPDGSIPAIAPDVREERPPADPVWGAALHRILINHWLHYGDRRVVDENLPALRRWADFQLGCRDESGVVSRAPISYGCDWLALEQTPPPVHHTAAAIDCLDVLAELEEAVGDQDAAALRRAQAGQLRTDARAAFFDPSTGGFGNGSQGSYACALESGILTGDDAREAARRILHDVRARGNRVSSGFAATRTVTRALARAGFSQALFDALQQPDEPGVGAMLDHGPGTLWECWWIDPNNTGTGSLDHVGLGGPFASWAWRFLAGVRPTAPGYAEFEVRPHFVTGVARLELTQDTVRGGIRLSYHRAGDTLHMSLAVPHGSRAHVRLPGRDDETVGPGEHEYALPWPPSPAPEVPAAVPAWHAPALAPLPSDQSAPSAVLTDALAANTVTAPGAGIDVLPDGIVCMPIPHAQLPGPVVRVTAESATPEVAPVVTLKLSEAPLDLTDATFAYAMLDLCLATTTRPMQARIVLHSADGSRISGTGRLWPAGWNRVAVDVSAWPGRTAVSAIEAGVVFAEPVDPAAPSSSHPPAFHLGEVGWSTRARTW